jgi:hypothetical protein
MFNLLCKQQLLSKLSVSCQLHISNFYAVKKIQEDGNKQDKDMSAYRLSEFLSSPGEDLPFGGNRSMTNRYKELFR